MRATIDVVADDQAGLNLLMDALECMTKVSSWCVRIDLEGREWTVNGERVYDVPELVKKHRGFLPGDLVTISVRDSYCKEYDGRKGVVTYGPDDEKGWLVTTAIGDLRCTAEELTMITPREERGN